MIAENNDFAQEKRKDKAVTHSTGDKPRLTEQTLALIKQADGRLNLSSNNILVKVHPIAMNPDDLVCTILNRFFFFGIIMMSKVSV